MVEELRGWWGGEWGGGVRGSVRWVCGGRGGEVR